MTAPRSVILLSDVDVEREREAAIMRFRLIYDGPLPASQDDGSKVLTKHKIRSDFHVQLRELWRTNRVLREQFEDRGAKMLMADAIADRYRHVSGWRFLPLVREELSLLCSIRILFLRRDIPGGVITSRGDLDNRLKTVIDALRPPRKPNEFTNLPGPTDDQNPFYVLMEDDKLLSHLEVEADTLLDPIRDDEANHNRARLVITCELLAHYVNTINLSYL